MCPLAELQPVFCEGDHLGPQSMRATNRTKYIACLHYKANCGCPEKPRCTEYGTRDQFHKTGGTSATATMPVHVSIFDTGRGQHAPAVFWLLEYYQLVRRTTTIDTMCVDSSSLTQFIFLQRETTLLLFLYHAHRLGNTVIHHRPGEQFMIKRGNIDKCVTDSSGIIAMII